MSIKSEFEELSDRMRSKLIYEDSGVEVNKPDFRELDLDSAISPLRRRASGGMTNASMTTTTTTSSSSSSSGSVSGRVASGSNLNLSKKLDSNPKSYSGELSAESSPSPARNVKPGHRRSQSSGSHSINYSTSGSVNSPTGNVVPTGNICRPGRILKTGIVNRSPKADVLRSVAGNYGHGSIMRGGVASKSSADTSVNKYSKGLMFGESVKKSGLHCANDPEELKTMGNENYKKGQFAEALNLYEKAIAISPTTAAYHCNRAAALIGMNRLADAVKECEEAIRLDPEYVRAHHRLGSLLLSLGEVESARKHICFPGHQPDPEELEKLQSVEKHLNKCIEFRRAGDWRSTLREADVAIASGADASSQLYACRAEALLKLHQVDDAFFALVNIPKSNAWTTTKSQSKVFEMFNEAYLLLVKTQIELARGRFDSALASIEQAQEIDSSCLEIQNLLDIVRLVSRARARGNDLFKSERFTEACSAYGEGLKLDSSNSVLYCNRAACWFKLGQWESSVDDCNQALHFQPNYIKALLRRAASNGKLERWSEAVRDYEVLRRELPDYKEVAESLFHSQVALKKSCGEEVYNMKFGGEVESVSGLEQFRAEISSPGLSVVHFEVGSNAQCKHLSPFLDTLCTRHPSISFLKVDIETSHAIAHAENVRIVPTIKIYKKGIRVKELICPSPEILESSVRHYSI